MEKEIKEITFGAKDSELYKFEYTIPEGSRARIEGNKVIIEKLENEDERIRKDIIAYMRYERKSTKEEIENRFIPWLEKHKEQKPAEWSEKDDALLKEIVSFFKDGTVKLQHDLYLYAGFLQDKFKSIRTQPRWKPSKEQINALKVVARGFPADDPGVIDSLLADLQKLL